MSSPGHILIIDDDVSLNKMLILHFEDQGHEVSSALDCAQALDKLAEHEPDIVLLDQQLPDGTGLDLMPRLLERDPGLAVVMMTGQSDLEIAIEAISRGALDFVHKPLKTDELNHVANRALEQRSMARQLAAARQEPQASQSPARLIGGSQAMVEVSKEIARVSPTDATVLITGESGTGKELVARAIHVHSKRTGPFVAVNSAAIVDTLLESELFGHDKGAFTGATSRKEGKFELARDGTLFLDEIGDLPLSMQAKLLRVLQEHSFERVGGNQQITTNARIVTATNRNLDEDVAQGRFRRDLLYRLRVINIQIPPLRERREDIPALTGALLEKIAIALHHRPLTVEDTAMRALEDYHWPGNVRELDNVLTQAAVRAVSPLLTLELIAPALGTAPEMRTPPQSEAYPLLSLDEVEAKHIQTVLDHVSGHKGKACGILGISRPALDRKIQKYQLRLNK
ncbi:MAG: sigma-54 dependent transcriptional regulator [Gammaproteobacteria bacterium]|jgi:two-component system response regulator AtoC|nr:sigma-54 dependent transcriptional regulator [Gammaproteobacteria bacterium]